MANKTLRQWHNAKEPYGHPGSLAVDVTQHRTASSGPATFNYPPEAVSWMNIYIDKIRPQIDDRKSQHVICSSTGEQLTSSYVGVLVAWSFEKAHY